MFEKLLQLLPGTTESQRVELYQITEPEKQPYLEVRLTSKCGHWGWCVEKRIAFAPGSIPKLREAINLMDMDARQPARAKVHVPHLRLVDSGEFNEAM